jgi:23S rRNA A1618 N6-methylase RlmF
LLTPLERDTLGAIQEALEFIDNYCDVVDDDNCQPIPNRAMYVYDALEQIADRLDAKAAQSAQDAHLLMLALRQAECPDDGEYLNTNGGRV